MDAKMFCFQCQETAKGTGCTVQGVCGKKSDLSAMMDMLLFAVRGIGVLTTGLRRAGKETEREVDHLKPMMSREVDGVWCVETLVCR